MKKQDASNKAPSIALYSELLSDIKTRVRQAQMRATLSANAEMIRMYWDVGGMVAKRQQLAGWGKGVIPKLAQDLNNDLPEQKGFSARNLRLMVQFYDEYSGLFPIWQPPVAKLISVSPETEIRPQAAAELNSKGDAQIVQRAVAQLPWAHNVILMQKLKDLPTRLWYMQQTIEQGWSRDVLGLMIKARVHKRQGEAITNFPECLPSPQSDLAHQYSLRDIRKPIGVSAYDLTRALPKKLKSSLPSIEEIEVELSEGLKREVGASSRGERGRVK